MSAVEGELSLGKKGGVRLVGGRLAAGKGQGGGELLVSVCVGESWL